jgi:GNAT superfamily N-acetyltransferase
MAMSLKIAIDEQASEADQTIIRRGVSVFSERFALPRNWRPLQLVIRSGDTVSGGLLGSIVWDWLQIDVLWIAEGNRGQGQGRALLQRAEQLAREHGCRNARVDTFDFEARGFYEKFGYKVYGELTGFPHGHSHFHLAKMFTDPATE